MVKLICSKLIYLSRKSYIYLLTWVLLATLINIFNLWTSDNRELAIELEQSNLEAQLIDQNKQNFQNPARLDDIDELHSVVANPMGKYSLIISENIKREFREDSNSKFNYSRNFWLINPDNSRKKIASIDTGGRVRAGIHTVVSQDGSRILTRDMKKNVFSIDTKSGKQRKVFTATLSTPAFSYSDEYNKLFISESQYNEKTSSIKVRFSLVDLSGINPTKTIINEWTTNNYGGFGEGIWFGENTVLTEACLGVGGAVCVVAKVDFNEQTVYSVSTTDLSTTGTIHLPKGNRGYMEDHSLGVDSCYVYGAVESISLFNEFGNYISSISFPGNSVWIVAYSPDSSQVLVSYTKTSTNNNHMPGSSFCKNIWNNREYFVQEVLTGSKNFDIDPDSILKDWQIRTRGNYGTLAPSKYTKSILEDKNYKHDPRALWFKLE